MILKQNQNIMNLDKLIFLSQQSLLMIQQKRILNLKYIHKSCLSYN